MKQKKYTLQELLDLELELELMKTKVRERLKDNVIYNKVHILTGIDKPQLSDIASGRKSISINRAKEIQKAIEE